VARVEADFASAASLAAALAAILAAGPACEQLVVVHLAALYSWWHADATAFQRNNVDAVSACRLSGVHTSIPPFKYIGTCSELNLASASHCYGTFGHKHR
jgi:nucleoside-diphosphate-sugar epimerase